MLRPFIPTNNKNESKLAQFKLKLTISIRYLVETAQDGIKNFFGIIYSENQYRVMLFSSWKPLQTAENSNIYICIRDLIFHRSKERLDNVIRLLAGELPHSSEKYMYIYIYIYSYCLIEHKHFFKF